MSNVSIKAIIGKEIVKIKGEIEKNSDEFTFVFSDGTEYKFHHIQDCCEEVSIEDVIGDIEDLIGSPLLVAEERTSNDEEDIYTCTWTFYEFATIKGSITVRWYGESNGYYSEEVDHGFVVDDE